MKSQYPLLTVGHKSSNHVLLILQKKKAKSPLGLEQDLCLVQLKAHLKI